jgi:hypothetical protein
MFLAGKCNKTAGTPSLTVFFPARMGHPSFRGANYRARHKIVGPLPTSEDRNRRDFPQGVVPMKIALQYREPARRVYHGATFKAKE